MYLSCQPMHSYCQNQWESMPRGSSVAMTILTGSLFTYEIQGKLTVNALSCGKLSVAGPCYYGWLTLGVTRGNLWCSSSRLSSVRRGNGGSKSKELKNKTQMVQETQQPGLK